MKFIVEIMSCSFTIRFPNLYGYKHAMDIVHCDKRFLWRPSLLDTFRHSQLLYLEKKLLSSVPSSCFRLPAGDRFRYILPSDEQSQCTELQDEEQSINNNHCPSYTTCLHFGFGQNVIYNSDVFIVTRCYKCITPRNAR